MFDKILQENLDSRNIVVLSHKVHFVKMCNHATIALVWKGLYKNFQLVLFLWLKYFHVRDNHPPPPHKLRFE